MFKKTFKFVPQHDSMDCGPACLSMISLSFKKNIPLKYIKDLSFISREGVSLLNISDTANLIGFDTISTKISLNDLAKKNELFPCILHWENNHFVVLYDVNKKKSIDKYIWKVADPSHGLISINTNEIEEKWLNFDNAGVALFLNPNEKFHENVYDLKKNNAFVKLLNHLLPFKKSLFYVFSTLLLGSVISFLLPFLTKNLIDKGVSAKNINLVNLILLGQLSLFISSIFFEVVRNWIVLKVGNQISINIIYKFLNSILKLPISFFETKMMGDFNQRINDNEKIESFLTSNSLTTFFSLMSILIYLLILGYFNLFILFVFGLFTLCAVLWSVYWLKKIKIIEYFKFQEKSKNQDAIFDMLKGINEIKLNNFERFKINNWKKIQLNLFKIKIRSLKINQIQSIGFEFFNQIKNILVTYLSAKYVIEGQMSLGVLLSISFIIGQLNSPIDQLIFFFKSLQDAKLSMNRIQEIEEHDNEDYNSPIILDSKLREDIHINNLDFQFSGPKSPRILNGINLTLPKGKITAIVGHSGSGKTTLMKLLLKFYKINNGEIKYGDYNINDINSEELRKNIGVVMQDGHVFSDTIERNIATSDEFIDYEKINNAIQVANLQDYISSLPLGLKTMIGESGNGISGGQKQRILIARAVYKNPNYIFFDEATSALDSENEKIIHENLNNFFHNKTVIIIAHRLSTVKNSDQIVVLKNGEIKEIGTHNQLIDKKGDYFNLIKNQLELSV